VTERRDQRDTWALRREAGEATVLGSLTTLGALAQQLVAVSGILIAVYFHAIAFGELTARVSSWTRVLYLAPPSLLVACLVSSLLVFFPDQALRGRLLAVRLATVFLAAGVISIVLAAVAYLRA
jgi:hypothetical protein